ncbi:MAG: ATP phosphoribosyltransferase [Oscillospiraceae bacterium]|nr:ATP phosphoribosyltransferase [Oscillospiraceae bacterium]
MNSLPDILRGDERRILTLRGLYERYGYQQYKMSKFEEYRLYAENKSFLKSESIITFNDPSSGRLMALKPDITLSIVKNARDSEPPEKVYYCENIYRAARGTREIREMMQVGLEYIGPLDLYAVSEVISLAAQSLRCISGESVVCVSHMGLVTGLLEQAGFGESKSEALSRLIAEKNAHGIRRLCEEKSVAADMTDKLAALATVYGSFETALPEAEKLVVNEATRQAVDELFGVYELLRSAGYADALRLDFSVMNDMSYYNGIIFQGFVDEIPASVLAGGRYDNLLRKLGKKSDAIGFAVYLDLLERYRENEKPCDADIMATDRTLNIALPKGRLGEKAYAIFDALGYGCPEMLEDSRKLIFTNKENNVRYFWAKPSDVAIYVERGAADIGVVGKDILLESEPDVYELCDLAIGKCRMAVAGIKGERPSADKTLRVATKFTNIAKRYYAGKSREIEIIHLNGSIEIAPLLELSDVIVDLVETGATLRENNLEPYEDIVDISSRLIANKASYKFKNAEIEHILSNIQQNLS